MKIILIQYFIKTVYTFIYKMFVLTLLAFTSRRVRYQIQPVDEYEKENDYGLIDPVLPEENDGELIDPILPEDNAAWEAQAHQTMLQYVNEERSKRGLRTLKMNTKLSNIVKPHNNGMIKGTVAFGHDGFESRARQSGSYYCGENVAYVYAATWQEAIKQLHTNWMNSPGHKANILNSNFNYFGFAYGVKKIRDRYYQCYATQFFAK